MFRIDDSDSYKWPVTVEIPRDGGKFTKATFTAEFKRVGQARINEIVQQSRDEDDRDFLNEVFVGFEDVEDADGSKLEYSETARGKLLDIPYVRVGLTKAFFESMGGKQNRVKN